MYKHIFDLGSIEGTIATTYDVARMEQEMDVDIHSFSFYCGLIVTKEQKVTYSIVIDLRRGENPFHLKREIEGEKYEYQLDEPTFLESSFSVEYLYNIMKQDMQAIENRGRINVLKDLLKKENMKEDWGLLVYHLMDSLKRYYDKHDRVVPICFKGMPPFVYGTLKDLGIDTKEFVTRISDDVAHMVRVVGQVDSLLTGSVPLNNNDILVVYITHELLTRPTMFEELAKLWGFTLIKDVSTEEVVSFLASRMDM